MDSPQAQNDEGGGAAPDGKPGDPSTHFIFTHKVFTIENCKFSLNGSDKMPCFYVPFDETQVAAIELKKIQSEFNIPLTSTDAELLKMVERGLKYVREIRPNDSIPREILDGSASWAVEDRHKTLATTKLNQALIFWMNGFNAEFPPLAQMQKDQKEPEAKSQIAQAQKKLTQLLGFPNVPATVQRLADIARETCYIEALRERAGKLSDITHKLSNFASAYKKEAAFIAEVVRMQDLMRRATKSITEKFNRADNTLKEILKALSNQKVAIETIRTVRDEVHLELKKWDEYFPVWTELKVERTEEVEKVFRAFYRFLAENYMEQQGWGQPKKK